MPVIDVVDYQPGWIFSNGHVNTLYAALLRKVPFPAFARQRYDLPDGDFLDVDWLAPDRRKMVVLCHGLEGSSFSKYILGTATLLWKAGYAVAALNHRSCSGEINRTKTLYHSGATLDLTYLLSRWVADFESVFLVGFSLGGNMVLKFLGEQGDQVSRAIRAAVAVSVPLELASASRKIGSFQNYLYEQRFLRDLQQKMRAKQKQFPNDDRFDPSKRVASLCEFDEKFTAPIHGFTGAEDYYMRCSGLFFLSGIRIPTLLINACDDPFLTKSCFPYQVASHHSKLTLMTPKGGGHVGFLRPGKGPSWEEEKILEFLGKFDQMD